MLTPIRGHLQEGGSLKEDFILQNMILLEGYGKLITLAQEKGYEDVAVLIDAILAAAREAAERNLS